MKNSPHKPQKTLKKPVPVARFAGAASAIARRGKKIERLEMENFRLTAENAKLKAHIKKIDPAFI
jgi:hypothetical protein